MIQPFSNQPSYPVFEPVPGPEIRNRVRALQARMAENGPDGVLLTHRPDVYYFSGTAQDCYAYVSTHRAPLLFVKRDLERAASETGIDDVIPISSVKQIPEQIQRHHHRLPGTLGLAFDVVPVKDYRFFRGLFDPALPVDASPLIHACRWIKSGWELARMAETARLSRDTFDFIARTLTPGETEIECCGRIEAFARKHGHSGRLQMRHYRAEGYAHHLLSGWAGGLAGGLDSPASGTGTCNAYPFGAGPRQIRADEPVLMDLGTMVNGYHMDETRLLVKGTLEPEALSAGQAAIDILVHVKELMKPGVPAGEIFAAAVAMADKTGLGDAFLGLPDLKSKFVGHGIGLELVEEPMLAKGRKTLLAPGMVFAVEPKFIFKDRFAAGIESVIRVTETGSRFLSQTGNRIFQV